MAGSKTNYLEDKLLDHVLGGGDYTRPATVYFALFTVAPGESGGGTECSGGGYARVAVTNDATNWPAASGGSKSNGLVVSFPVLTGSIGTVAGFGIFDASSGGNLLYYYEIPSGDQKSYDANDVPVIPVGAITITED